MIHWLAHLFGWNYGRVETWHEGQHVMAGFRCSVCGKLSGKMTVPRYISHPEEFI